MAAIQCSAKEPPKLDERQAAIMKAQGYLWDAERGRWFRGDPSTRDRRAAECRSSCRCVRFVESSGRTAQCGPAVQKAVRQLESALQTARTEALGTDEDATRAFNLEIKDKLASKWAPYAWGVAQLAGGLLLSQVASAQGATLLPTSFEGVVSSTLLGLATALPLSFAHRKLRSVHSGAGVEGSIGQLERILADSICLQSHALPAPWESRLDQTSEEAAAWRRMALLLELVATSNSIVLLHGALQPAATKQAATLLVEATGAYGGGAFAFVAPFCVPLFAIGLVSLLPALSELYFFGDPLLDGVPAELDAASRLARNADSLFLMKAAPSAAPEEATASATALRALAAGWEQRFGAGGASVASRAADAALAAAGTAVLTGTAWQLGGGHLLAPLLANGVATCDAYLVSADAESARASVLLPEACDGR